MGTGESLRPYVAPLLGELLASAKGAAPPWRQRVSGALLLSDIAGFTALTASLERRGRLGAEEIARVVNRVFQPGIDAIEGLGGQVLGFGGDALLSRFPSMEGASAAAAAMERVAAACDAPPVRVTQAVHPGPFVATHLGVAHECHLLIHGRALRQLAAALHAAPSGDTVSATPARRAGPAPFPEEEITEEAVSSYVPRGLRSVLGTVEGDLRHVAVLFLETRGDGLSSLQHFYLSLQEVLEAHGGLLLKSDASREGSKWMCLFGVPTPVEADVERALRAAVTLRERPVPRLSMRAAVHAGVVACLEIGTAGRRSFDVMGDAVNTAARALPLAAWGEVVAWAPAGGDLPGASAEARGSHRVKGKDEPLTLLRVRGVRGRAAAHVGRRGRLVGRGTEMTRLLQHLDAAAAGSGSAVVLRGPAGIGKTRLALEIQREARLRGFGIHEGRAIAYGGAGAWAIADLVRSLLALPADARPDAIAAALEREAGEDALGVPHVRHVGALVGASAAVPGLTPASIRENGILGVRSLVRARAASRPLLVVLDDLQWCDDDSVRALAALAEDAPGLPLLLLLVSRKAGRPEGATEIALSELSPEAEAELVRMLLGDASPELAAVVRDRGQGNPLFVEELARHLVAIGACALAGSRSILVRKPAPDEIPAGIEALLSARLAGLSAAARRVIQVAAAVGRSCRTALLAAVAPADADAGIAELIAAGILEPGAEGEHAFRHALVRDVAYASTLARRRRELHASVAAAIEEVLEPEREQHLAILGKHWDLGGEPARAFACYREAAGRALGSHALADAEHLLRACIALQPSPREREEARCTLAMSVLSPRGRLAEALEEAVRAGDGFRASGDPAGEGWALCILADVHIVLGDFAAAGEAVAEARRLCREAGQVRGELKAVGTQATLHLRQGRLQEALLAREEALSLARALGDTSAEGQAMNNLAGQLMNLGRLEEASELFERALAVHRAAGNPRSEGIALSGLAFVRHEQGRTGEAVDLCRQDLAIAVRIGDRVGEGMTLGNLAIVLRRDGRVEEARDASEAALRIHLEARHRGAAALELQSLASLHLELGVVTEAERYLDQAIRLHRELGDVRGLGSDLILAAQLQILRARPDQAGGSLAEAARLLEAAGDPLALLQCQSESARLALARGEPPDIVLQDAERRAQELGLPSENPARRQLDAIRRAAAALARGEDLLAGLLPGDVPQRIRDWLARTT